MVLQSPLLLLELTRLVWLLLWLWLWLWLWLLWLWLLLCHLLNTWHESLS